ncbi:MAG: hypothetical protein PHO89_11355, partial [Methylacidiphilaceae bacterium]|nr:hypothetical protein [Candidatus Methylacidiphilaceae bacterium]
IATNSGSTLFVDLPGTITNNAGATISNVGGSVRLYAGSADLPLFAGVGGGAVINHGSVIAFKNVLLAASDPDHVGPNPGGGVFSDGQIQILASDAHTSSFLYIASLTGNAFLGGTVTTPHDPAGLNLAVFQSGPTPAATFTLGTNVTADSVTFTGGSLRGPGTVTTNTLSLNDFVGNVNNVTSPTNYLANGFHVANGSSGNTHIAIDLASHGEGNPTGRQVVNLNVSGNATLSSGVTSTFGNGLGPAGILPTEANVGSNLLVQASGNMTVNPGNVPFNYALSHGALGTNGFVFPGGIVLMAGKTLTLNTVVDNGYAPTVAAGQGIFFQAPHIVTSAPVITNGNAWVNFSTAPSTVPTIYGVTPALTVFPLASYTIVTNPSAYHIRSYAP